ncbi:hypothetical protein PRK78_002833 [Emydomyces testavorans]|uniref:Uncharacterized protein n=1 Tax=Emydomyces testavorans TaxID=2070801 RepID=A0AAF0DH31_9EURO|nr:hypothetical protein PRK78_002833 [Emydomyces testavorans]
MTARPESKRSRLIDQKRTREFPPPHYLRFVASRITHVPTIATATITNTVCEPHPLCTSALCRVYFVKTHQREHPEDDSQRQSHAALELGRFGVEVEGEHDGTSDDAKVHGQTQPGEECTLVGAVVAAVGGAVVEDEGAEEGAGEDKGMVGGEGVAGE